MEMVEQQPLERDKDTNESSDPPRTAISPYATTGIPYRIRLKSIKCKSEDCMHRNKRHFDEHIDDAGLLSSLYKGSLNKIIGEYKYLFTVPLYWTHRHEKALHVVWQPLQPPSQVSLRMKPRHKCKSRPSCHRKLARDIQEGLRKLRKDVEEKHEWSDWMGKREINWLPFYKSNPLRPLPPQRTLPSLPGSFELTCENSRVSMNAVLSLQNDNRGRTTLKQREAMQILLSAVDQWDQFSVRKRLLPSQKFLRVEKHALGISYGQKTFQFLLRIPTYRMDAMPGTNAVTNDGSIDGRHQGPTTTETKGFWRMIHIDYAHVFDGMWKFHKLAWAFTIYGVRRGISRYEYSDRYEYEYGKDKWNQPHFVPGVFIAMAQRYQARKWTGQKAMDDGVSPTWQILLTDGPNDNRHAHIYTTQVPPFLVDCFKTPAKWYPPPNIQKNGTVDHESETAGGSEPDVGEVPFNFPIRHTMVEYEPHSSFRERLREAIMFSRDSFRITDEHAQCPEKHKDARDDQKPVDTTVTNYHEPHRERVINPESLPRTTTLSHPSPYFEHSASKMYAPQGNSHSGSSGGRKIWGGKKGGSSGNNGGDGGKGGKGGSSSNDSSGGKRGKKEKDPWEEAARDRESQP
ncbi:hypothetical protein F5Y10DRAFT_292410 [Nemania abortiva]|nr:hypothetical protein F5Y10DRAFT_292410 [Nemania abortiva]